MFLKKIVLLTLTAFMICGLISCKSDVKITAGKNSYSIYYSTLLGTALKETVAAFSDGGEVLFDTAQIEEVFSASALKNVSVESKIKDSLEIKAEPAADNSDFLSQAEIVTVSENGNSLALTFTSEKLAKLYENMPEVGQSYIDMFMAPAFTGEKMTDSEYLDLVASVYGQVVADEISKSEINFVLTNVRGKSKTFAIPLLDIINLKKELVLKI